MPEEFLDGADVIAAFQEMRREAMPEGMATGGFGNPSGADGAFDGVLQVFLPDMVPAFFAAARVDGNLVRREDVLLCPLAGGIWILAREAGRKISSSRAAREIPAVQFFCPREVALERVLEPVGKEGDAFLHPLGFAHGNLAISEIDVFHPQSQALEETQAASVEKVDHEAVIAFYLGKHGTRFRPGKNDRHFRRAPYPLDVIQQIEFSFEDLLVEEKQRGEGLVLGGSRDLLFDGEMGKEGGNFLFPHFVGMALMVEQDETPDPIDVSLFGAQAVVLDPKMPADPLQ